MVLVTCERCGDISYLNSVTSGNVTEIGYKCRNCNTINRITLEDGELKQDNLRFLGKFYEYRAERNLLILYLVIHDLCQI